MLPISLSFVPKGWGSLSPPMQRMLRRARERERFYTRSRNEWRTAEALVRRELLESINPGGSADCYRLSLKGLQLMKDYDEGQRQGRRFMEAMRGK